MIYVQRITLLLGVIGRYQALILTLISNLSTDGLLFPESVRKVAAVGDLVRELVRFIYVNKMSVVGYG